MFSSDGDERELNEGFNDSLISEIKINTNSLLNMMILFKLDQVNQSRVGFDRKTKMYDL
jgi:hypothetical protein